MLGQFDGRHSKAPGRIERDFPDSVDEVERLLDTAKCRSQDTERIQGAIVLAANGDFIRLRCGV